MLHGDTHQIELITTQEGAPLLQTHRSAEPSRILRGIRERGIPNVQFDPADISRLSSPCALLNDICINGGARLLNTVLNNWPKYTANTEKCAVLTTHDLPRIRYRASDAEVWRHISGSHYWDRDIWVVPIHRPYPEEHWVCCVVHIKDHRLHLFDSLGSRRSWRCDTQVHPCMVFSFNGMRMTDIVP